MLPFAVINALTRSTRLKFGLFGLLCLSIFSFVASVIKGVTIHELTVRNDTSYSVAVLLICSTIENNLVIIGGSIPTLKALFRWLFGPSKRMGSTPGIVPRNNTKFSVKDEEIDIENAVVPKSFKEAITRIVSVNVTSEGWYGDSARR